MYIYVNLLYIILTLWGGSVGVGVARLSRAFVCICVNVFVLFGFMHCIFCILASRTLLKNEMVYLRGFNLLINLHFYYSFFAIIQFNPIFVKETRAMLNSGLNLTLLKHLVQSTMNHTLQLVG